MKQESADSRLLTWRVMAGEIVRNPLSGTGFGTFEGEYAKNQAEFFRTHPDSRFMQVADAPSHGFNEYLQIGMETGIPGILLLAAILVISFIRLYRTKQPAAYGLLSLMVFALFSYPLSLIPFQILLALFICQSAGSDRESAAPGKSIYADRISLIVSSCLIIAITTMIRPYYNEKILAAKEWKEIRYFYNMGLYHDCLPDYAKLYPTLSDNPRFLFEYGHSLNKMENYTKSNPVLEEGAEISNDPMFFNIIGNNYKELGDYGAAEESYAAAFAIVPNRLYPLFLLMNLYKDSGQHAKAREIAKRIIEFRPKVESSATKQMREEAGELI